MFRFPGKDGAIAFESFDSLKLLSTHTKRLGAGQHVNHRKIDKELSKVRVAIYLSTLEPKPLCTPGCEISSRYPVNFTSVHAADNVTDNIDLVPEFDTAVAQSRALPRRLRLRHPNGTYKST